MTVTVRLARPDELDAVGELTAAAYLADGFGGGDYTAVLRDARARAEVAEVLVAADVDDTVLGTATLVGPDAPPSWRETHRDNAGTIRMLATAPSARSRGAGTALTEACVARARERGWSELTLVTEAGMTAAHRIYGRLGFKRDTDLDRVISPELTLLGYSLALR